MILDSVQFEKNYFQNRNRIRSASSPNGWIWVTVPVLTKHRSDQLISEVPINNTDNSWGKRLWSSIQQNYGTALYFYTIEPFLRETYVARSWELLVDLNLHIIRFLQELLGIETKVIRSSELGISGHRSQLLLDICKEVGADTYLSGPSGRDYLDLSRFSKAGVALQFHGFHHPVYSQVYSPFVAQMSVIDLIANYGPRSAQILTTGGSTKGTRI